jgi:hypothetical protein
MSAFGEYLVALFEHWEPLVGAAAIVLAVLWPRVHKWLEQHPNRQLLWVCLFSFCLFLAGFLTWKDERDRYIAEVFRQQVPTYTIEGGATYQISRDDYFLAVASVPDKTTILKLPPDPYRGQRF